MENEQDKTQETAQKTPMAARLPKQGDSFVTVGIVDLAVSLFTLGFPFYDPANPYLQQRIKGERSVRFLFERKSNIEGAPTIKSAIQEWNEAEQYAPLGLSHISICKRAMWARRTLLRDAKNVAFGDLQGIANDGFTVVDNLRLAAVAYALGFEQPEKYLVDKNGSASFIVGTEVPEWLKHCCPTWDALVEMNEQEIGFISAEGNELHPVAVALAAFINIAAWVKHLSSSKPYNRFYFGNNQTLLVQEDSPRWHELIKQGYSPE